MKPISPNPPVAVPVRNVSKPKNNPFSRRTTTKIWTEAAQMNERKRRPGRPPAGDRSVRANSTVKNAASEPVAHATSQWGGKRAGAGRPTKAKQRERAQEAAEAMVLRLGEPPNLKESMRRLHNAYESLLVAELAKGPHGSKKFIIECGQGMRG